MLVAALLGGGCDAISGIDELVFERGLGQFCDSLDACVEGTYCDLEERLCKRLIAIGGECTSNEQCESPSGSPSGGGRCVHGYCCNGPCNVDCLACDLPDLEGSCTVVPENQDPHDHCPGTAGCGTDGRCRGRVLAQRRYGADRAELAAGVAIDAQSFVYVAGTFEGTVTFDIPATSAGGRDVFVLKLDPELEVVWAATFGGPADESVAGLALDADGNVLVAGDFGDTMVVDGSPHTAEERDVFVAKLDGRGNAAWVRVLGPAGDQLARDLVVDDLGRAVVTGSFEGSLRLDTSVTENAAGMTDAFVAAYDGAGVLAWHRIFGDAEAQRGVALAADAAGNTVAVLEGRGTVDTLDGTPLSGSLSDDDVFVVKLAPPAGATAWDLLLGGSGDQHAAAAAADGAGDFWIAGSFDDRIAIPGEGELSAEDGIDGFFVKLAANGSSLGSGALGGPFDDLPHAIALDPDGNALVAGQFELALEVSAGGVLHAIGAHDVFVVKLDPAGAHLWGQAFGGPLLDDAVAVAADASGNLAIVGHFEATLQLGDAAVDAAGDSDLFVALLAP